MARLSAKLRSAEGDSNILIYWCQGCERSHQVRIGEGTGPRWEWDGNAEAPTFAPSVLCWREGPNWSERCHTFIRGGIVQFLGDCTHKHAGQTLPLPDWPYAEGEYGGV